MQFNPSPNYDLSGFTPLEYYGAYYIKQDFTEGYDGILQDFLKED